jgi:nitroimidazol reductase NimA-like FMN-containing flavoprotein (pyridoxamine 5'-phosphate oxidase superfamily)
MVEKLSKSDVAFIQQLPVGRLATVTKECEPVVRPIWPVFDSVFIYFASDPDMPKLEQIEENPEISLVFDDYNRENWGAVKGIRVQGEAEIMWEGEEYRYAHSLLEEKYPEYRTADCGWKEGDVPIIKITPTSYSKWATNQWKK